MAKKKEIVPAKAVESLFNKGLELEAGEAVFLSIWQFDNQ